MDAIDKILNAHVAQGDDTNNKVLGAAFVVVDKNDVLHTASAGRIDFDPSANAFADDSYIWVASLTKLITTTCIMQIVEKGLVSLDDDVRPLVPAIRKIQVLRGFTDDEKSIMEDNDRPISLRMLLTHTTGLTYDNMDPSTERWAKAAGRKGNHLAWTNSSLITMFKFPPGESWVYGISLDWAGKVLEAVTGQTIGAYMQDHIFGPLGMKDTGFWPEKNPEAASRTVSMCFRNGEGLAPFPHPLLPTEHEIESAGAGLFTTAKDYSLFLRAFLAGKLLSQGSMDEIFKPQLTAPQKLVLNQTLYADHHSAFGPEFPKGQLLDHGLAGLINIEDVPGKRQSGSISWSGALNSRWWVDPKSGIAATMVLTVARHGDAVPGKMWDELEKAVYASLK